MWQLHIKMMTTAKKAKFAHSANTHGLHIQLALEGKRVGVKSGVILRGADTSPQHKTNKQKRKYCFWENGMNAASDTVKQTTSFINTSWPYIR
jgi:hypothetical protein